MTKGFVAALALAVGQATEVTPIQKVVELLDGMHQKGVSEKEAEATKFAAFSQWCKHQDRTKANDVAESNKKMDTLNGGIMKAAVHIRSLNERVVELEEDIGRWAQDSKSITDVRGKEEVDFKATVNDYSESLEALEQAISVLKKQDKVHAQAGDFLQVKSQLTKAKLLANLPWESKQELAAFLQAGVEHNHDEYEFGNLDEISSELPAELPSETAEAVPLDDNLPHERSLRQNPEAHGYEFQSGGVIDMLEKLRQTFREKKTELEKEEMNAKHNYDVMLQQLTDNTENANHEAKKKRELSGQRGAAKADMEGDLAQTTKDRDEDQKYKDDTAALCAAKTRDFESRQQLRAEELEAIEKATEIIRSNDVSGSGEKHLPKLVQIRAKAAVLAQLRRGLAADPVQKRIASFLASRSKALNSQLLSVVSQHVASDPFGKVKKMIQNLISKLMEEATAESEHKGWCDAELGKNKVTRDAKTEDVSKLSADIDDLSTNIAKLADEITLFTDQVAEIDASVAEATKNRQESKATNEETITDAKGAQEALRKAMAVLQNYYEKSSQATAFSQQTPAEDAPETFSAPYKGMLPEGGNIVDFLEVIFSDFARLESETSASEALEVSEFKKFMSESAQNKALKTTGIKHKSNSKSDKESELHATKEDLTMTQEQLDKAIAYYEKLKPSCVDSGITYEERVQRRKEEMQSLQEALNILTGTDADLA